jgi:hypothetical protein
MRYVSQRDSYSCGSIAVLNTLKWSGMRVTYKSHMKRVNKLCNANISGILDRDITTALSHYKSLKFRVRRCITMRQLDSHLKKGGCAIIAYEFRLLDEECGHYIFIPGKKDDNFIIVNDSASKDTIIYYDRKEMVDLLRYRGFRGSPCAWLISKR